ncbi:WD40 repeat-like protein [Phellopilus nigrolimitatus]|nr:WD40 repeat-like protein [Phellopilus nigrolimitatus]
MISEDNVPVWSLPQLDLLSTPKVVASGRAHEGEEYLHNFFRCAKWCPDGGSALAQCEDRTLQMLKPSLELAEDGASELSKNSAPIFQQPAPILDFAWYPGASTSSPGLYCFLASVRECPVKLLDAADGRVRASYKIVDHRERQVAPHSIVFNSAATHVYCGYEDAIEVFDFQRPGEGTKLATTPSKKSRDGMKGIVSSIAFCPDYSGLFAASSLSSAITLFSEATGEDPIAYLDGMTSAVTQVKFDPARPHLLYASQRRSDEILCWDVREPFEVVRRFARKSHRTNQKLLFDVDPAGRWLAAGDEDGYISLFDLQSDAADPAMKFQAHDDSIGSVAFNPAGDASLLSVSGSRHFSTTPHSGNGNSDMDTDSSDAESDQSDAGNRRDNRTVYRRRQPERPFVRDSSAKVWKLSTSTGDVQAIIQS